MPLPRPLDPTQARRSFAQRFAPTADRLRQIVTNFGLRPYRVWLVWTRWSGTERGVGKEKEVVRLEILPTPKIANLDTSIRYQMISAGYLPTGSIMVSNISALLTQDQLTGLAIPTREFVCRNDPPTIESARRLPPKPSEYRLPNPYDFYWLVCEDGRGDDPPAENKFRLSSWPWRDAGNIGWRVALERVSSDPARDGDTTSGFDPS